MLAIGKQEHKLYEVTRATSMAAVAAGRGGGGGTTTVGTITKDNNPELIAENEQLKAEIAALRAASTKERGGEVRPAAGTAAAVAAAGGSGTNAARSLR